MPKHSHVLLVEDDPRDVEITLDVLGETGVAADVTVLHDGAEATDYLYRRGDFRLRRLEAPAVILLDVKMPKVNGFELLRKLKGDPEMSAIPIVLLTSSHQERDLVTAYELQADGYLMKPIDARLLAATIENAIQGKKK